jgi:hypothetical protein
MGYKLMGLDDLGHGDAGLVLEEQKNHYMTFLKICFDDETGHLVLKQIEPPRDPTARDEDNGNAADIVT